MTPKLPENWQPQPDSNEGQRNIFESLDEDGVAPLVPVSDPALCGPLMTPARRRAVAELLDGSEPLVVGEPLVPPR